MSQILNKINNTCFINGEFIKPHHSSLPVVNPASQQIVGYIPNANSEEIQLAIDLASRALEEWKKTSPKIRADKLRIWYKLIIDNLDELAYILTLEQGKPLEDAKKEIIYGANFVRWFASEAENISGTITQGTKENQKIVIDFEPIGVVGAITPWNFPSAMVTRKIAPALAAGCTIVLKPSDFTPFSALALAYLANEAGIPAGVINIITGDAAKISNIFSEDYQIRKISFTGSTRVGKLLYSASAPTLKKLSLELGGNAPFIICEDADIGNAVECLIAAKLRSSGQACTSPNRILIANKVYDEVVQKLKNKVSNLKIGNGFNPSVNIGPLIRQSAVERIENLIHDACAKGAKILAGGKRASHYYNMDDQLTPVATNNCFLQPTILIECNETMDIFKEEIFGPVIACYRFNSEEEAIALANNTNYGLSSYLFTTNHSKAWKLSALLDYGIVGINEAIISNEIGAFGGRKDSGFGIEGSHFGIYEFLNTKYKCINY